MGNIYDQCDAAIAAFGLPRGGAPIAILCRGLIDNNGNVIAVTDSAGRLLLPAGILLRESVSDTLTAVGTTQATALALTSEINRLTTVAAGTGVSLPAAVPGLTVYVINHGANPLQVYGAGTDQIDDIATATCVTQM